MPCGRGDHPVCPRTISQTLSLCNGCCEIFLHQAETFQLRQPCVGSSQSRSRATFHGEDCAILAVGRQHHYTVEHSLLECLASRCWSSQADAEVQRPCSSSSNRLANARTNQIPKYQMLSSAHPVCYISISGSNALYGPAARDYCSKVLGISMVSPRGDVVVCTQRPNRHIEMVDRENLVWCTRVIMIYSN